LAEGLRELGLDVRESPANFLLVRVGKATQVARALRERGIRVRDATSFGLPEWLRLSAQREEAIEALLEALEGVLASSTPFYPRPWPWTSSTSPPATPTPFPGSRPRRPTPRRPRRPWRCALARAKALIVWGTGSGVGKSLLTAGLLRHFRRLGLRAAPFKAQNMANHARVVAGGEMASAQWLQALAAGAEPEVRMNPILIKPFGERGAQVVVWGRVDPRLSRLPWRERRPHLEAPIREALEGLRAEYDLLVLEGAGSPAERNLWPDLPNLKVAQWAEAKALLVADVDQGGALGALYGTWALLGEHRERLLGFVFNKFRGDLELLRPAYSLLQGWTGVPVLGTLPLLPLSLPEEDGFRHRLEGQGGPRVALLRYPHAANLDEFWALGEVARPRYARTPEEAEGADLLVLPGSRLPARDLPWLRAFLPVIRRYLEAGKPVLAICGGAEMLSEALVDEEGVEERGVFPGLGLLPFRVRMRREKTVLRRRVRLGGLSGPWEGLNGLLVEGYEIHHGEGLPLFHQEGSLLATWLHGLLENPGVQRALFGREARGLDEALDHLADALERHLDLSALPRPPPTPRLGPAPSWSWEGREAAKAASPRGSPTPAASRGHLKGGAFRQAAGRKAPPGRRRAWR
jgi:adenosylcobyric acid synthase